jgi:PPOX class probable F420-dependent enzyme
MEVSAKLAERLKSEQIIWITTVRADGTPQPTPVWFVWDNGTFLIYSQPNTQKLRNIAQNARVTLHFNTDMHGDEVIVITGEGLIDHGAFPADQTPAYLEKYADGIKSIDMTPASYAQSFSVAIRVKPLHVREMNTLPPFPQVAQEILALSSAIRYVAIYAGGQLISTVRENLADASASESDKYEELILNPTLLKLVTQRGNIDCGGLNYVLIRYGNFFQFVTPFADGHVSVCIAPETDPLALVKPIFDVLTPTADL